VLIEGHFCRYSGNLNPKVLSAIVLTPKCTSLCHNACFELLCVKIHLRVTSVGESGEKVKIKVKIKKRPYTSRISPDAPLRPIGTNCGLRGLRCRRYHRAGLPSACDNRK